MATKKSHKARIPDRVASLKQARVAFQSKLTQYDQGRLPIVKAITNLDEMIALETGQPITGQPTPAQPTPTIQAGTKRETSPAARKKIAAAQKRRWAKIRAEKKQQAMTATA